MPASSWVIEVRSDQERHVIAKQTINPGQIIIEETAYAWVLNADTVSLFCDCCLQPLPRELAPFRCSACKLAHYGNKDHQRKAWQQGHKQECEAIRSIAPRLPPPTVLLAVRTVLTAHRKGELAGAASSATDQEQRQTQGNQQERGGYAGVLGLMSHWEDLDDGAKIKSAQLGALTWELIKRASSAAAQHFTPRDLALLISRFSCNLHTIADDELSPLGFGLYPVISMINHSCNPNAVQSFKGSRMTVRAIRRINPGEEICIAYVELAATRWERRSELLHGYYFDIDAGSEAQIPKKEGPGGAVPCDPDVSLEIHSHMPWKGDDRDTGLTAVVPSASIHSSSSNGGQWGMWGQLASSSHADAASHAAAERSFGLGPDDNNDEHEDNAQGHIQGPSSPLPLKEKLESKSSSKKAEVHCWGFRPGQVSDQDIAALARTYAHGLKALAAAEAPTSDAELKTALAQLQTILRKLDSGEDTSLKLGPRHVLRIRILAAILRLAIADGTSFDVALTTARDLLPLYTFVYPSNWPNLGLHYAALAKLEHYCGDLEAAAAHAHAAIVAMETALGGGRAVVADLERIRREATGEFWEARRPPEDD